MACFFYVHGYRPLNRHPGAPLAKASLDVEQPIPRICVCLAPLPEVFRHSASCWPANYSLSLFLRCGIGLYTSVPKERIGTTRRRGQKFAMRGLVTGVSPSTAWRSNTQNPSGGVKCPGLTILIHHLMSVSGFGYLVQPFSG